MEITIFAKNRKTQEGKTFTAYSSKLTKKDGTEVFTDVRFREECGAPSKAECPCNIIVKKGQCNMITRSYIDEASGEEKTGFRLWITGWQKSDNKFEDHSMDDFM